MGRSRPSMASATGQRRVGHPRRTGACSVFHQFHKTQKGQSFQTTLSAFGGGCGGLIENLSY